MTKDNAPSAVIQVVAPSEDTRREGEDVVVEALQEVGASEHLHRSEPSTTKRLFEDLSALQWVLVGAGKISAVVIGRAIYDVLKARYDSRKDGADDRFLLKEKTHVVEILDAESGMVIRIEETDTERSLEEGP